MHEKTLHTLHTFRSGAHSESTELTDGQFSATKDSPRTAEDSIFNAELDFELESEFEHSEPQISSATNQGESERTDADTDTDSTTVQEK